MSIASTRLITNACLISLFLYRSDGEGEVIGGARTGAAPRCGFAESPDSKPPHDVDVDGLVRRAAEGDAETFGQLYDLYLDRIYRYVYYRLGNFSDAEDIAEEIFLKAWEALPRYRSRGVPFAAWLFRLARNHVVDYIRTRHEAAPLVEASAIGEDDPGDVVSRKLSAEAVRNVLTRLTGEQREVIILKFMEGLNTKEIAQVVGRQEGAVRALQMRALQALRQLLIHRADDDLAVAGDVDV